MLCSHITIYALSRLSIIAIYRITRQMHIIHWQARIGGNATWYPWLSGANMRYVSNVCVHFYRFKKIQVSNELSRTRVRRYAQLVQLTVLQYFPLRSLQTSYLIDGPIGRFILYRRDFHTAPHLWWCWSCDQNVVAVICLSCTKRCQ